MHLRPIRDGESPFHDDPEDIAHHIRDNALRNIEAGQPYITDVTLRYLEHEAISRFAAQTGMRPTHEPDMYKEFELWRSKWCDEARYANVHINKLNAIAQASVRVLLTAGQLRSAIEDDEDSQKISALSMLLVCEVLIGGYSLEFDANLQTKNALQKAKFDGYRKGFGKEQDDMNAAQRACIIGAEKRWKDSPLALISTVADELEAALLRNIEKLPKLDTVPKAKTIKVWLRKAAREGKLAIPEAAQKRGRPPKVNT